MQPHFQHNWQESCRSTEAAACDLTAVHFSRGFCFGRGKRQCAEAILPATSGEVSRGNGSKTERVTLNCINFDMNWNIAYSYSEDAAPVLPKGTIIHVMSWYDNTTSKFNPDSKNWVGNGPRSVDIMSYQWQSFFYLSDEEYAQKIQQRKARSTSNQQQ